MSESRDNTREWLGQGLAFPLRVSERGGLAMAHGPAKVRQSVELVIETAIGSRIMRSQFGSPVPALLFEALTPGTVARMRDGIMTALNRWEPRIEVLEVTVARDPEIETKLIASVEYRLRDNNALFNQVFDFYLSEGAEANP